MSGFRAGFAQVDVTPPAGTPMAGYPDIAVDRPWTPDAIRGYVGRQRQVAAGTHDPLLATAVAIECDGARAVVVGLDTLVLERRVDDDRLRASLAGHGVAPENVLVGASHTHGGPDLYAWWGGRHRPSPAPATLAGTLAACERALAALEPVELRFGVGRLEDASVNRATSARASSTRGSTCCAPSAPTGRRRACSSPGRAIPSRSTTRTSPSPRTTSGRCATCSPPPTRARASRSSTARPGT
ncbi:MAG: neutral/alkaline non-lysosomal ceramidase N-terminal domain-containing protein [Thermoleophilia bacterium]